MKNYYIFRRFGFSVSVIIFIVLILLSLYITQSAVDNFANLLLARQMFALDVVTGESLSLTECDLATISTTQAGMLGRAWLLSHNWTEAEKCLDLYIKKQGHQSDLVPFTVALLAARHGKWTEAVERITQSPQRSATVVQLLSSAYQSAAVGNWARAEVTLRRTEAYLSALPLFAGLFADVLDRLQLTRLRQEAKTPEEQLALATQYWRLARYDVAGSLSRNALTKSKELSARQRAWAWYIIAADLQQKGQSDKVLPAYLAGIVADPTLIANYWDALNWRISHPKLASQGVQDLTINLEHIVPEGQLRQWTLIPPVLLGYTIVPNSDLAPDGIYDIYLFWSLTPSKVAGLETRQTSRWTIQRVRVRNQAALGQFDFNVQVGGIIPGWEEFLFTKESGTAIIQSIPGASGGALRLVPNGNNPVGLRSVPPLTGIPVKPRKYYLLTGRVRVDHTGVVSIRCIWYTSNQEASELDGHGVPSYFEVYDDKWIDKGVLLVAPPYARSCELRVVYGAGIGNGWFDDIRFFELPNVGGD